MVGRSPVGKSLVGKCPEGKCLVGKRCGPNVAYQVVASVSGAALLVLPTNTFMMLFIVVFCRVFCENMWKG